MDFIILVVSCALAALAHWGVVRDNRHAIGVGVALFVFSIIPFAISLYGGK